MENMLFWEEQFIKKLESSDNISDPSHDLTHFKRVGNLTKKLAIEENAALEVVVPAALLHDMVTIRKDNPLRKQASYLSAVAAVQFLNTINYPSRYLKDIFHAIEAHSYSSKVEPRTLEAKIVQDADRLDALGAIGISRCFVVSGQLNTRIYHWSDPLSSHRDPDDSKYALDHFTLKLFSLVDTLKTNSARKEGSNRLKFMKKFIDQLKLEIELSH